MHTHCLLCSADDVNDELLSLVQQILRRAVESLNGRTRIVNASIRRPASRSLWLP